MKFQTIKDEKLPLVPESSDEDAKKKYDEMLRDKFETISRNTRNDLDALRYKRELAKNGSFSVWTGGAGAAPDAWSKIGAPTAVANDDYTLKITSNGSGNEGCSQTLKNLKASQAYTIVLYARATAGDTAKVWTTGADIDASGTTTSEAWTRIEVLCKTDSSATDVVLCVGSDNATDIVWFDEVQVLEY